MPLRNFAFYCTKLHASVMVRTRRQNLGLVEGPANEICQMRRLGGETYIELETVPTAWQALARVGQPRKCRT